MGKIKPNEKCPCGSNLKYKKCCSAIETAQKEMQRQQEVEKFATMLEATKSTPITDDRLLRLQIYFGERYKLPSLNMSDTINAGNLTRIHTHYKSQKVFLMLARNEQNEGVFEGKGAKEEDIMVIYRNNYQLFNYDKEYDEATKVMDKWI